jgi:hypothetical protein
MTPQARNEEYTWGLTRGPTNAEILGPSIEALPPTLDDYEHTEPHGIITLDEAFHWTMSRLVGVAWANGDYLARLRWLHQLDQRLPLPSPQDHGVYLVTAPCGQMRYRFIHWSLYSQGHFYHLTAVKPGGTGNSNTTPEPSSRLTTKSRNPVPVFLKLQTVIEKSSLECAPLPNNVETIALQAYHIGGTRFTADQIRQIAKSIIANISSYSISAENCQLFAISLAERTTMTRRDCSVFVGNMFQIAAWDSAGRPGASGGFFQRASGYVLADPQTATGLTRRHTAGEMLWLDSWRSLRVNRHALEISELYSKGENALGTFDPEGRKTGVRYIWYRFRKKDFPVEQFRQIHEDFEGRKWRDVFYGRLEERRESYVGKEVRVRNGSTLTRLMLPLHRALRGVTKEERKRWAAEAEEVSTVESSSIVKANTLEIASNNPKNPT